MKFFSLKRRSLPVIIGLIVIALWMTAPNILAADLFQEGTIPADQVVADDLYLNAPSIKIQGEVAGMLVAIGQEITIDSTATLKNDSLLIARSVTVNEGAVFSGNLVVLAQNANIAGVVARNFFGLAVTTLFSDTSHVEHNLFFSGYQLDLEQNSQVGDNLYIAAYQALISGKIENNLYLLSTALQLDGRVSKNAYLRIDPGQANEDAIRFWMPYLANFQIPEPLEIPFLISGQAEIGGQVQYSGPFNSEQALINFTEHEVKAANAVEHPAIRRIIRMFRLWISLIFTTIITLWFFPIFAKSSAAQVAARPLQAAGIGLISLISIYIGLFLLILLVIASSFLFGLFSIGGLGRSILALVLLALLWITVFFGILVIFVSKFIVSFWLGRQILRRYIDHHRPADLSAGILGVTLFVLASAIPYIGWVISLGVTIIGLGAMWYVNQTENWLPFLKWKA